MNKHKAAYILVALMFTATAVYAQVKPKLGGTGARNSICIAEDNDRLFSDTNCSGTKNVDEEYLDVTDNDTVYTHPALGGDLSGTPAAAVVANDSHSHGHQNTTSRGISDHHVKAISTDIDHDATINFAAVEHVDWASSNAGTIDPSNYADDSTDETKLPLIGGTLTGALTIENSLPLLIIQDSNSPGAGSSGQIVWRDNVPATQAAITNSAADNKLYLDALGGVVLQYSAANKLQTDAAGVDVFGTLDSTGNITAGGTVTGTNLSGENTGNICTTNHTAAGYLASGVTKDSKCLYVEDPVEATDLDSIWRAPQDITITEVWCEGNVTGITLDLTVDDGSELLVLDNSGAGLACGVGNVDVPASSASSKAVEASRLDLNILTNTNNVSRLSVCFEYTYD